MPKGRHVAKGKINKEPLIADKGVKEISRPSFRSLEQTSPLLTLLFDSKDGQHAALSRIEAFYESHAEAHRYLTLEKAKHERLCQNYEAFNFPIEAVKEWLRCMKEAHAPLEQAKEDQDKDSQVTPWWKEYCNGCEIDVLEHLLQLGVFQEEGERIESPAPNAPVYLISTLTSKQGALHHERLHFFYYISPEYRAKVQIEYQSLSVKSRKIIENDLNMRKYSSTVWIDEFQAYISEDASEFGKSIQQECQSIQTILKPFQQKLWKDLKF